MCNSAGPDGRKRERIEILDCLLESGRKKWLTSTKGGGEQHFSPARENGGRLPNIFQGKGKAVPLKHELPEVA